MEKVVIVSYAAHRSWNKLNYLSKKGDLLKDGTVFYLDVKHPRFWKLLEEIKGTFPEGSTTQILWAKTVYDYEIEQKKNPFGSE